MFYSPKPKPFYPTCLSEYTESPYSYSCISEVFYTLFYRLDPLTYPSASCPERYPTLSCYTNQAKCFTLTQAADRHCTTDKESRVLRHPGTVVEFYIVLGLESSLTLSRD